MNPLLRPLFVPLAAALVSLSGCVVNVQKEPAPDLSLQITFDGLGCRDARIDEVRVTFEDGYRSPIVVACDARRREVLEIVERNVRTGTYRLFVEGLDQGYAVYSLRREIRHEKYGSHLYRLDLRPSTELLTNFTFAGTSAQDGLTCAEARIKTLDITIGSLSYPNVACSDAGRDAALFHGLEAGRYDVTVDAHDKDGRKLYSSTFERVNVFQGSNEMTLNLLPLEQGRVSFAWEFKGASGCAAAGVSSIDYELVDADGLRVEKRTVACGSAFVDFGWMPAGLYQLLNVRAYSAGNALRYEAARTTIYSAAGFEFEFPVVLNRI